MKKLTYLLFCLSMAAFGQNTLIPDPNFEQALIDLGYDTAPINGSVPTSSISGVTYLDVSNKTISDLTGIEDFTALTDLYCRTNQLTSLDVSNNTALTLLECGYNQLTSLDVSNNTALTLLECRNNQLTSLNTSNNIALTYLRCNSNQLTSLDVSNNTALTRLYCWENQLISLDVSNNTALTQLRCNSNQLTNLDVSNNTALTRLYCWENQITTLDLSNKPNLHSLEGYSNQLQSLDIRNSPLTFGYNGGGIFTTYFNILNNPDLSCIYVDDVSYATAFLIYKDYTATFVTNEAECDAIALSALWTLDPNGTGIYRPTNTASGDYSIASGYQSEATGSYSTAMGNGSEASGNYSFAVGSGAKARGVVSTAMGNAIAEGRSSFAIGVECIARGDYSFAIGTSYAEGDYSFTMGYGNAYGDFSTAMGGSVAYGDFSNTMGYGGRVSDYASTVIGHYNLTGINPTSATSFSLDAPAFVIGNGFANDDRSDAFSILFDGTTNIAGSVTATSFIGDGSQLTNLPNENTDDQAISYDTITNIVSLEDGGTIDLSGLSNSGTDNQTLSYNTNTNIVSLEDGGAIDLSGLNNSGTDDQQLANFVLSQGSLLSLSIQDGNVVSVDLAPILADLEEENAQQQTQIDQQQALIDDLIIRMEIREECACDPTLGIGDNTLQADKAYLLQNIPNPFDRTTSIGYFVPYTNAKAHIVISTMAGQIVHNIELSNLGVGAISIDSGRMAAAVYLYTLYVDGKRIDTKRMIVE